MAIFDRLRGKKNAGKAVVLGIDGMPYTLALNYAERGVMPRLAEVLREGSLRQMDTSYPEVSSVAWTSFMTGVNPAKHGFFGFLELKPGTYEFFFPDANFVKSPTLWDIAAKNGKKSVVINVPSTYPAKPVNGMLVSGFVALDIHHATYPKSHVPTLQSMDYRLDVASEKAQHSLDDFVDDVWATLNAREKALFHYYDNEEWDLFVGVLTETDRVQHFLFDAYEDENHKYHAFFLEFYSRVDEIIGKIYERVGSNTPFFMLSDHGFTTIDREVYLNRWMREEGYLRLKSAEPRSFDDVEEGTRALVLDPGRIYIHLKGKYPRGTVEPGEEYESLRTEIKNKLLAFEVDGKPAVKQVFYREEIYNGGQYDLGPDMVVLPNWHFDMKGAINRSTVTGNTHFRGMHTQDDAMFFANRAVEDDRGNIVDIFPSVLTAMGLEVPDNVDGKNLVTS